MNREVMGRQMFAHGGQAYPMQDGGGMHQMPDGSMMPDSAMAPMPQGPAPIMPGMPPADMANVDINQAAQGAMQQGLDPAVLEGMLGDYSQQMEDLDNAEDYETVINGIRGDQLPMEARYAELAGVVGQEDARSTPESVLTLVQPVMQLAAVDQGIGGLAQDEMSTPIEGPMAEGIMSTVNMGAPEGPASVNFNQGGAVQYMEPGGAAMPNTRVQTLFDEQRALTDSIYGATDEEADLEEQKNLTQAQMLFDVAQGALAFASPGDRQMSPAERLAQSFTPVIGNIGARAGELGKFKQAQKDRALSIDMSNLQSAQTNYQGELTRAAAAANVKPGDSYQITDAEGAVLWQGPVGTVGRLDALMKKYPSAVNFIEVKEQETPSFVTFINPDDNTDFHTFDANNFSATNVLAMEKVRQSVNAEGQLIYRITGNYTPKSDSGTGASVVNFKHPTTGDSASVNISTPAGIAEMNGLLAAGYQKAGSRDLDGTSSTAKIQTVVNRDNTDDIRSFDLNNAAEREEYDALGENWVSTTTPTMADLVDGAGHTLGNSYTAKGMELLSNHDVMEEYASDTLNQSTANLINSYITKETIVEQVWDVEKATWVMLPGLVLTPTVMAAIAAREKIAGASLPIIGGKGPLDKDVDGNIGRIQFDSNRDVDYSVFDKDPLFIISGIDLTKSQGFSSGFNRFFNLLAGQFKDVTDIGSGYTGESGKITSIADTELNTLARKIMTTARSTIGGTRIFSLDVEMLADEVKGFQPGAAKTDNKARDQLVAVRNNLAMMYSEAHNRLSFAKTEKDQTEIMGLRSAVENLIAETTAAIAIYDRFLTTDPIEDAVSDRSVTGGLSRASDGVPE